MNKIVSTLGLSVCTLAVAGPVLASSRPPSSTNWIDASSSNKEVKPQTAASNTAPATQVQVVQGQSGNVAPPEGRDLRWIVWTNHIARTNGRTTKLWEVRRRPPGWPTNGSPVLKWQTNSLLNSFRNQTAISQCHQREGSTGQIPMTAITRRHVFFRGHGTGVAWGASDYSPRWAGTKVWFCTDDNQVVERVLTDAYARVRAPNGYDYSIGLLSEDLPDSIVPMRVVDRTNFLARYERGTNYPYIIYATEQLGHVSANHPPDFSVNSWKGGDSGSPNMIPLGDWLYMFGGSSCHAFNRAVGFPQSDMDALCAKHGLDPAKYQLKWLDLSPYRIP